MFNGKKYVLKQYLQRIIMPFIIAVKYVTTISGWGKFDP